MAVEIPATVILNNVEIEGQTDVYVPVITTDDYSALSNKPSINGVVLIGDKSSHDLHLADLDDLYNYYPTDTAQGAIASFPDGAESVPVKSLSVTIEPVQSGTGDPSPSNVRPISGHSTAVVTRTGGNLFNKNGTTIMNGYIDGTAGTFVSSTSHRCAYIPCKPNTTYTVSKIAVIGSNSDRLGISYAKTTTISNGTPLYGISLKQTSFVVGTKYSLTTTTSADAKALVIWISRGTEYDESIPTLQVEVGSTATDYASYVSEDYTISLDGTRYGGTLDVTNGVLTVKWLAYQPTGTGSSASTGNWFAKGSATNYHIYYTLSSSNTPLRSLQTASSGYDNLICSHFATGSQTTPYSYSVGSGQLRICLPTSDERDTSAKFNAWVAEQVAAGTPLTMVAYLKEENYITVQLTPTEVTTLLGDNNIFCSTGDVEVTYRADMGLFIRKVIGGG